MRRILTYGIATLAFAMVLAACQVSVGPGDGDTFDYSINAQMNAYNPDAPTVIRQVSVPGTGTTVVRVRVGQVPLTTPPQLAVMEIDAPAGTEIEVRTAGGQLLGVSADRRFFASSRDAALAATPLVARMGVDDDRTSAESSGRAIVEPLSVGLYWDCLGPCVAFRPVPGPSRDSFVYIRSPQARQIGLLAYVMREQHAHEPNDTQATATPIAGTIGGADVIGAIERLGDSDFYRISSTGWSAGEVSVELVVPNAPPQLDIYIEFLADNAVRGPNDPVRAFPGEVFVVRAHDPAGGPRVAGPALTSRYIVHIDPVF
jgi:hypothetical protein